MHEQVYVNDIVSQATRHGTVEHIVVEVGELAPIPAAELAEALKFTGWRIDLVTVPGTVQCPCGFFGRPVVTEKGHDFTVYHCPKCGQSFPRIVAGRDVILKSVSVADE